MSHALVPLAQGCEELEAITITDLLVRAGITVTTVGLDDKPVVASRGTTIIPDTTVESILDQKYDLIVLPGGLPGADHLRDNEHIQTILKQHAENNTYIGAICAAPKVLEKAGLLNNKKATAYPGTLEAINNDTIDIQNSPVVIDENIITSRGPGTTIDFTLQLIELLEGKNKRDEVNLQLAR